MSVQSRPLLGFCLALIAAMTWGTLAPALKLALREMDSQTLVWFRFLIAMAGLFILLKLSGKLPRCKKLSKLYRLIALGIIGLAGNFILFNSSLIFIPPTTAQVIGQLSPFVMMFASIFLFKETLGLHQKIGIVMLLVGLGLFFNERLAELFSSQSQYSQGIWLAGAGSSIWALYGIAQKRLSQSLNAQQILFIIYCGCTLIFTPTANPSQITQMSPVSLIALSYCCLNTLIGYGAYAEAIKHFELSKVSATSTLIPVFTLFSSILGHYLAPQFFDEPELNTLGYIGAFTVVFGAMFSAIGHKILKCH